MKDLLESRIIDYNSYYGVLMVERMMTNTVKLGEKGQITLPKSVRDAYQWDKGTQFRVIDQGEGCIAIVPIKPAAQMDVPSFKVVHTISDEQMDEAIAQGASEDE